MERNIGKKAVRNIKLHDINTLRVSMEKKGHSKQTKNGCSPRTIKKVLIQTLKPIMQYALDNGIINKLPKIEMSKHNIKNMKRNAKKHVTEGSYKLALLYKTINELYYNDPFYRALFLFALYGRRWNEIRTLKWSDIDYDYNKYTIRAENNKIGEIQIYDLPEPIKIALKEIKDNTVGIVFKSPITNKELYPPKNQLNRIKELSNIPELTMHYFRHILVSAMGEMGTATTILSASLGHTNLKTVNDFYLSANHTKSSQEANKTIEGIVKG
jgi:integrase